jgi:hypothetical protein
MGRMVQGVESDGAPYELVHGTRISVLDIGHR